MIFFDKLTKNPNMKKKISGGGGGGGGEWETNVSNGALLLFKENFCAKLV